MTQLNDLLMPENGNEKNGGNEIGMGQNLVEIVRVVFKIKFTDTHTHTYKQDLFIL